MDAGRIVVPSAGKEACRVYAVVGRDGERFALIADGRHRTIEKPKKKNIRHLTALSQNGAPARLSEEALRHLLGGTLTNKELWRALSLFAGERVHP